MPRTNTIAEIAKRIEAKKLAQPAKPDRIKPTPEREMHNKIESAGPAKRVVVPIRHLFDTDRLTPSQFDNLAYYRAQANQAQDDEKQSGPSDPAKMMGGGSGGFAGSKIPASLMHCTPAILETARIERELLRYGQEMLDLVRFVARDDNTLAQWCIRKHGGRERYKVNKKGVAEFVAVVPICEKRVMKQALIDLKYAAGVIVR